MDLWTRVDLLVRSWLDTGTEAASQEAWDELEAFLQGEVPPPPAGHRSRPNTKLPPAVHQALSDLELQPGAGLQEIRGAYRKQLLLYHPDRHTSHPEHHAAAAEITRRLTLAYRTLCEYYG